MGTWIVGAAVLVIIGLAAWKVYKDRKNGKGCGCGCDGCPSGDKCASAKGGSGKGGSGK